MTLLTSFIINVPAAAGLPGALTRDSQSFTLDVGVSTEEAMSPLPSNAGGIISTSVGNTGVPVAKSQSFSGPSIRITDKVALVSRLSPGVKVDVEQNVILTSPINISMGDKSPILAEIKNV